MTTGKEVCAVVLLMVISLAAAVPLPNVTDSEANRIFHSLKEYERIPFLLVELAKGLLSDWPLPLDLPHSPILKIPQDLDVDEKLYMKFQEMDIPKSFGENLLKWVMSRFRLSHFEVKKILVSGEICAPDGTCFDTGDIGDLCCPF